MTDLQMGLIGLGLVAVAGVTAYNKWLERRQREQADEMLKADHPDVLLGDGAERISPETGSPARTEEDARVEPVLRDEPEFSASEPEPEPESEPKSAGAEPTRSPAQAREADEARDPAPLASAARTIEENGGLLSPLVDFIAAIELVEPAPAQRILDASGEALARVRKPVRWIGHDEKAGEWQWISGSGEYRHLRAGLQLVNRRGPAGEEELAAFVTAMRDIAEQLTGIAELPPRQGVLEAAAELDRFCAAVDIQIGINVISQGQPFPGTKLRALAESNGMVLRGGRFERTDDEGKALFALLNREAQTFSVETMRSMSTRGLTFLLDVPCVAQGERRFAQMMDLAKNFAGVLRGAVVDDELRPLSDAALEPISRQIGQYQAMLAEQQLPAGSRLTQRLFS
jgi:FtsZ-interacting cell division protein ZipA